MSSIFTEIDKVKINLSPTQIAELTKFPLEVVQYINSISQNFITYEIFHRQCKQYAAKKNLPLNIQLRDKVLDTIRKREAKHKNVSRADFLRKYNMLFHDNVGVSK